METQYVYKKAIKMRLYILELEYLYKKIIKRTRQIK